MPDSETLTTIDPLDNSLGPHKEIHAFWLAGMSCDGCSIAAFGAYLFSKGLEVRKPIN